MYSPKIRATILIGMAVAALALVTTLVRDLGADAAPPSRVSVSYADLDIDTDEGAAVLYHRIRVAAAQVCAIYGTRDLAQRALRKSCTERAVVEAVAAVDNPAVAARYFAQFKDPAPLSIVASR